LGFVPALCASRSFPGRGGLLKRAPVFSSQPATPFYRRHVSHSRNAPTNLSYIVMDLIKRHHQVGAHLLHNALSSPSLTTTSAIITKKKMTSRKIGILKNVHMRPAYPPL